MLASQRDTIRETRLTDAGEGSTCHPRLTRNLSRLAGDAWRVDVGFMSASRTRQRSIYSISEYGNISPLMSRVTPWDPYSPWIRNTPMGEARISVPLLRTTSSRPLAGPHAPNIRSVDREQVYICKREVSLYSFSRKRSNLALWIWFPSKKKKKKK